VVSRSLTSGEQELAQPIFKDAVDYSRVRIHNRRYIPFQPNNCGLTPRGTVYAVGIYSPDYSREGPHLRAFFIHEMVHVWQHQGKILRLGVIGSAVLEMIRNRGNYSLAYPYVLDPAMDLTDYNLEQQAAIVEDYFRLTKLRLSPQHARLSQVGKGRLDPRGTPALRLYEVVLSRFLQDPTYGKRFRQSARTHVA